MATKASAEGGSGVEDTMAYGGGLGAVASILSMDHGTGAVVGGAFVVVSVIGFSMKMGRMR